MRRISLYRFIPVPSDLWPLPTRCHRRSPTPLGMMSRRAGSTCKSYLAKKKEIRTS